MPYAGDRIVPEGFPHHQRLQDVSTPVRRRIVWNNATEKAQWIDGMAYTDAHQPTVRRFAVRLAFARDPNDQLGLVRDLHRWVRDNIRYVPDPSYEEIADTATILERTPCYGDCDDKARAFVALCRAVGVDARIRPVFDSEGYFYHVQAEVRWSGSERFPGAQPGGWVLAELILRGCELGQAPHTLPQSSTGSRVLE